MRALALIFLLGCGGEHVIVIPTQLRQGLVDAAQVKSYKLFVLNQIGRDNNPLTCDALLSLAISPDDDVVLQMREAIEGNFDGTSEFRIEGVPSGDKNRMFYIDLYDQADLLGERIGAGCAPSVTVTGGKVNKLVLEVAAPPKPVIQE